MRKLLVILTLAVALLLAPTAQAQDPVEIDFLTYLTGPEDDPDMTKWETEVAIKLADG